MPQAVTLRDRAATSRPRLVRNAIVLGRSTLLARRAVERGCFCVEKSDDDALTMLLSLAYERRIHLDDPMTRAVLRAADVLLKSPERVDSLLAHLQEPSTSGITRLPEAERLLKAGVAPADLAKALRRDRLGLREAPAYADRLTLCDKGVVLGQGTVIAALEDSVDVGLVLKGREGRILALLSVASGQAINASVLDKFEAASRALGGGDVSLAAIHLAHAGLPPLAHTGLATALALAADELSRGIGPFELLKGLDLLPAGMGYADWSPTLRKFNPNHLGPGCPEGGQFCSADQAGGGSTSSPKRTYQVGDTLKGNASYYGNTDPKQGQTDRFAGRPTASGSIMDPTAMTGAVVPNSVAIGSVVQVTRDDEPSRSILVTVNDNGLVDMDRSKEAGDWVPIPGNRVIDLSPAAFKALAGSLKEGIIPVTVTTTELPKTIRRYNPPKK